MMGGEIVFWLIIFPFLMICLVGFIYSILFPKNRRTKTKTERHAYKLVSNPKASHQESKS